MKKIDLRRVDLNLLPVLELLMQERGVTRAADRLGRTQSALSHALARLREQLDDPLLMKSGGRMAPTPFAEQLVQELRPILARIERVLSPRDTFDPATTTREFRIAIPDLNDALFPAIAARLLAAAPGAHLEWVPRDAGVMLAVAEGQIDIALVPHAMRLPDEVEGRDVSPMRWASFLRRGHPAERRWGRAEWLRWPHVAVRVSQGVASPVDAAIGSVPTRRRIAVHVPNFSAVAPLLASTDLIATLPLMVMSSRIDDHGLRVLKPPIRVEPIAHRLVWSRRLARDPALVWLREQVAAVVESAISEAEALAPR